VDVNPILVLEIKRQTPYPIDVTSIEKPDGGKFSRGLIVGTQRRIAAVIEPASNILVVKERLDEHVLVVPKEAHPLPTREPRTIGESLNDLPAVRSTINVIASENDPAGPFVFEPRKGNFEQVIAAMQIGDHIGVAGHCRSVVSNASTDPSAAELLPGARGSGKNPRVEIEYSYFRYRIKLIERGALMLHEKVVFEDRSTIDQLFDAIETFKGPQVLMRLEEPFVSVTDLLGHTTNTPNGLLIHFSPMNTVLFEHVPKQEFFPNGDEAWTDRGVLLAAKGALNDEAAIGDNPESKGDPYIGSPR
jgi:hypothetical protein